MYEELKKKLREVVASLIEPAFQWLQALPWKIRAPVVLSALGLAYAAENPETVNGGISYLDRAVRVTLTDTGTIPLAPQLCRSVHDIHHRLLGVVGGDINLISTGALTGWSASQALLGLAPSSAAPPGTAAGQLVRYIRARRLPECLCWAELNNESAEKAWTFMNGWVLAALASNKVRAEDGEIAFLLDQQLADGSWPPIPLKGLDDFASVYSTSWAVLGLLRQQQERLITNPVLAERSANAITRGASWLLSNRSAKARWKPYPHLTTSSESGSISGLAMHVLHKTMANDMATIDREWLDNIPASPLPASLGENYYIEIKLGDTKQIDHFVQLTMPWMVIATIEAYEHGSWQQKIRALGWLEQTLSHESITNADAEQGNWWRAELLISLNYLSQRIPVSD